MPKLIPEGKNYLHLFPRRPLDGLRGYTTYEQRSRLVKNLRLTPQGMEGFERTIYGSGFCPDNPRWSCGIFEDADGICRTRCPEPDRSLTSDEGDPPLFESASCPDCGAEVALPRPYYICCPAADYGVSSTASEGNFRTGRRCEED